VLAASGALALELRPPLCVGPATIKLFFPFLFALLVGALGYENTMRTQGYHQPRTHSEDAQWQASLLTRLLAQRVTLRKRQPYNTISNHRRRIVKMPSGKLVYPRP
jgi:Ribosomal protein L34e